MISQHEIPNVGTKVWRIHVEKLNIWTNQFGKKATHASNKLLSMFRKISTRRNIFHSKPFSCSPIEQFACSLWEAFLVHNLRLFQKWSSTALVPRYPPKPQFQQHRLGFRFYIFFFLCFGFVFIFRFVLVFVCIQFVFIIKLFRITMSSTCAQFQTLGRKQWWQTWRHLNVTKMKIHKPHKS